jgi:hypothetical protein
MPEKRASALVHGSTSQACPHGVNSNPNIAASHRRNTTKKRIIGAF